MHDTTSEALNASQISLRSPLLPPDLPWPELTQQAKADRPPSALEEDTGSLSIALKRRLSQEQLRLTSR